MTHISAPHHLVEVTPSDTDKLNARGFWVNVGGDIAIVLSDGDDPVTLTVPGGVHLPYPLVAGKIMETGTTATGIFLIQG